MDIVTGAEIVDARHGDDTWDLDAKLEVYLGQQTENPFLYVACRLTEPQMLDLDLSGWFAVKRPAEPNHGSAKPVTGRTPP
jgi:hypothetical protein